MSTDTPQPFKPAKGRPYIAEMLIRKHLGGRPGDELARIVELIDEAEAS